jgi:hypothetical protein
MADRLSRSKTAPEKPLPPSRRGPLIRAKSTPEEDAHSHIVGPQFLDDHGAHGYHQYLFNESDDEEDLSDEVPTVAGEAEARFGVRDEHGVEENRPEIKRAKTTQPVQDPNLVSSCISWSGSTWDLMG